MEGTRAGKGIFVAIVGDENVAHFRMNQTVQRRAVHHRAAADAGSDGDVQDVVETARRSPSRFGQRRRVDVGIEGDRQAREPAAELRKYRRCSSRAWASR